MSRFIFGNESNATIGQFKVSVELYTKLEYIAKLQHVKIPDVCRTFLTVALEEFEKEQAPDYFQNIKRK